MSRENSPMPMFFRSSPTPEEHLDQSYLEESSDLYVGESGFKAQIFQVGVTGSLTRVVVKLWKPSGINDVTVKIQGVVDGLPNDEDILAFKHISGESLSTESPGAEVEVVFSTPPDVVNGTSYAIVFSVLGDGFYVRAKYPNGGYENGSSCERDEANIWTQRTGEDCYFKTYVTY